MPNQPVKEIPNSIPKNFIEKHLVGNNLFPVNKMNPASDADLDLLQWHKAFIACIKEAWQDENVRVRLLCNDSKVVEDTIAQITYKIYGDQYPSDQYPENSDRPKGYLFSEFVNILCEEKEFDWDQFEYTLEDFDPLDPAHVKQWLKAFAPVTVTISIPRSPSYDERAAGNVTNGELTEREKAVVDNKKLDIALTKHLGILGASNC